MRFIVDEMPKRPNECPFAHWETLRKEAHGEWFCYYDHKACKLSGYECRWLKKLETEAKPVAPVPNETLNKLGWDDALNCGACGEHLRTFANYCDHCGRPVAR